MKKLYFLLFLLCGCQSVLPVPPEFEYKEIRAGQFTLASWQKISDKNQPVKVYIEGDGRAFTASGRVSIDPTPRGNTMRKTAFGDNNPNVVYLARPCQFIKTPNCTSKYWSNARFSPEIVDVMAEAVNQIAGNQQVVLIGYSGGAQIAGLISVLYPEIKVKKAITIAGNLDHVAWMEYHHLPKLDKSLNLGDYKTEFSNIPQVHYVGQKDDVLPPKLAYEFVQNPDLVKEIKGATHGSGWEQIYPLVWAER